MEPPKKLTIQVAGCTRTMKEVKSYQKELADVTNTVAQLRENNDATLKQWEQVLSETEVVLQDSVRRLHHLRENLDATFAETPEYLDHFAGAIQEVDNFLQNLGQNPNPCR
jgi:ABC-type transporter Mla subunit MlaD